MIKNKEDAPHEKKRPLCNIWPKKVRYKYRNEPYESITCLEFDFLIVMIAFQQLMHGRVLLLKVL